jgi:CHAP domain
MARHSRISALVAGCILLTGVAAPSIAQSQTPTAPSPAQVSPSEPSAPPAESPTPTETPSTETTPATSQPEDDLESVDQDDPELQNLIEEGLADETEPIPEASTETSPETNEIRGQRTPAGASTAPRRFRALQRAATKLGYTEGANNSNVFSAYFGRPNVAWCAAFVSWAFDAKPVGNNDKRLPWKNPLRVASILAWGRQNNQIVKQPEPGDLFIMQARGVSHMGFVRSVRGSVFSTVEGNTTKPGNRRVEGVFSHNRDMRKFPFIFVRVPARTGT